METHGQTIAGPVNRRDGLVKSAAPELEHVQDRPEDFLGQYANVIDFDQRRREEGARVGTRRQVAAMNDFRFLRHTLDMGFQHCPRSGINCRANVGRQVFWIANDQFVHIARQQVERPRLDFRLHTQQTQCGTTLSGTVESRVDAVVNDLLGQRRTVHEHRVLTAGLRDQRADRANALGQRLVNGLSDAGRSGEYDAGNPGIRDGATTNQGTGPWDKMQHIGRHTGLVHQLHGPVGDQRCRRRRFREHGIPRGQCGGNLARKYCQREVPGTDADKDTSAPQAIGVVLTGRPWHLQGLAKMPLGLCPVVTEEIHGLAQLGNRVRDRFTALPHTERQQFRVMGLEQVGGTIQNSGTFRGRRPIPGKLALDRKFQGLVNVLFGGQVADANNLAGIGRIDRRLLGAGQLLATDDRLGGYRAAGRLLQVRQELAAHIAVRKVETV